MILSFLFKKRPFIILRMTIFYVDFQKHSESLVTILQSECETAINWLYNNKMIVNPDKFQVIFLDKGRSDNTNIEVEKGNGKNQTDLVNEASWSSY